MRCCRCSSPAAAWLAFEYAAGHIDLFDLGSSADPYGGYSMCERHASAMTPPVGWTLTDHRAQALRLFPAAEIGPHLEPVPDCDVA